MVLGPISGSGKTVTPLNVSTDTTTTSNPEEVRPSVPAGAVPEARLPPATAKPAQPGGRTSPQNLRPAGTGVTLKGGGTGGGPATPLTAMDRGVADLVSRLREEPGNLGTINSVSAAFQRTLDGEIDLDLDASLYRGLDGMYAHPERLGALEGSFDLLGAGGPSDPALDAMLWSALGNYYDHPERANAAGSTMDSFTDAVFSRYSGFI